MCGASAGGITIRRAIRVTSASSNHFHLELTVKSGTTCEVHTRGIRYQTHQYVLNMSKESIDVYIESDT